MFSIVNAGRGDYRQALTEIWAECFGDDEAYTKQVFIDMYRPLRTLVLLDDDRVIGATQFTKYTLKSHGGEYFGIYIYGVCVKKEYRHQGLATKMLRILIKEHSTPLHKFFFLISAADKLYEGLGFKYVTCKYEYGLKDIEAQDLITEEPLTTDEVLSIYNRSFKDNALARDDHIANNMLSLYNKDSVAFKINDKIIGYALKDGSDYCEELVCTEPYARDLIYAHLQRNYPGIKVRDDSGNGTEVRKVYVLPIGDFDAELFKGCYISPEI